MNMQRTYSVLTRLDSDSTQPRSEAVVLIVSPLKNNERFADNFRDLKFCPIGPEMMQRSAILQRCERTQPHAKLQRIMRQLINN